MKRFYSHGKLLITGEYVVLDGAIALAVPSVFGQSLEIKKGKNGILKWTSVDEQANTWFEIEFSILDNEIIYSLDDRNDISQRLLQILNAAKQLNSEFLYENQGYEVTTILEFPKNWGLGTSSTLISNVARWAKVDPYALLELTFGGSGYDIACANAKKGLTYQLNTSNDNVQSSINFNPMFKDNLFFVYLNQKQNSRDGIKQYRENTSDVSSVIDKVNTITQSMIKSQSLVAFQQLMNTHEQLISEIIKETPIKRRLFNDFNGSIKSLGAWGGDFVLVASQDNPTAYFKAKGYTTILSYSEMVLA
ncbi:MAG: mevalonate kinase [Psychroserpens sp.]|jgi:mevalonate kinase|uniref:GYDIA family GHMP kinase n=1 Tax=Psychroserpens sp. TaxID=2020870 RepID=UPI0039E46A16